LPVVKRVSVLDRSVSKTINLEPSERSQGGPLADLGNRKDTQIK